MIYRPLGPSGMNVSVISFGAWQIGDDDFWGPDERADAKRTVQEALDAGVNFFDTAEAYGKGESERVLGKCLGSRRREIFLASKVSTDNCAPDRLRAACEGSLKRLGTDYLDLYQVHWPPRDVPFSDVAGALQILVDEGKIRAAGLSNFGPGDMDEWFAHGGALSNQIGYNMLFRAPEHDLLPECRRRGLGVLVYMPLMQGLLAGRYDSVEDIPMLRRRTRHFSCHRDGTRHGELGHETILMETVLDLRDFAEAVGLPMSVMCLSWLIAQPGVTSAVLGARNPAQLQRNLAAATLDIGPAAVAQLNEITYPLKRAMGHNCDMWQSSLESRIR